MNIEQLNKHQIILVCLLVSFVSSIATGIVTVSLLDQAPPVVTQTINRVVQTTVEKVAPNSSGTTVTKTVVVSENDAVVNAIEKSSKGIALISGVSSDGSTWFAGLGVIASSKGYVIARADYNPIYSFRATLNGGIEVGLSFVSYDETNKLTIFKADNGEGASARTFTPVSFANASSLKLGQTIVAITGPRADSITTGVVSSLVSSSNTTEKKDISRIRTDIYIGSYQINSVATNLSGEIVGLKIGAEQEDGYVSSDIIKSLIPTI